MKNQIVKIMKMGINGEGIGYINRVPVFVEGALVNETVEVEVIDTGKNFYRGTVVKIMDKSTSRVKAKCPYQSECGGCALMVYDYKTQLYYKKEILREALRKYAHMDTSDVDDVVANDNPFYYRNQCKLPVKWLKGTLYSGMYKPNTNHLIYMDECVVHEKGLEEVRRQILTILNNHGIRDYNEKIKKGLRYIVVRGLQDKYQCTLVTGRNEVEPEIVDEIMKIEGVTSLYQNVNTKMGGTDIMSREYRLLAGVKTLELKIDDNTFRLSPASFFQLNYEQALKMYRRVVDLIEPCELLVEGYAGIGIMSLMLKHKATRIIGVEFSSEAVKNANNNARINHVENHVKFECGDAGEVITKISKREKIDTLLVDPPRSGLDDAMIDCIIRGKIKNVVYVSCNPSTLAKNLNDLLPYYEVKKMIPYDLFSETPLVETVVSLKRKK